MSAQTKHAPKTERTRWSFGYPFLTDTIAMADVMQINPSGYEETDRHMEEATGHFIAERLNEATALRAERDQLADQRAELLEALTACMFALGRDGANVAGGKNRAEWEQARAAIAKATGSAP